MSQTDQSSMAGALDALWTRFLPEMESRVTLLESAAEAFQSGKFSQQQREEAHSAAHKLAGVLGIFGFTRGTDLARELETIYSGQDGHDPHSAERLAEIAAELRGIVARRK